MTFLRNLTLAGASGHGVLAGSVTAVQCPSRAAVFAMFKARSSNAGSVYLGNSSSVTVPGTTTNTTGGFELAASEQTPWMPCKDLDEFFYICDNTGDEVMYWIAVN